MQRSIFLLLLPVSLLAAGCTTPTAPDPGDADRAPVSTSTVDQDGDGRTDWIRLDLDDTRGPYEAEEVRIDPTAPDGSQRPGFACRTPRGNWTAGCFQPFEAGDTWRQGSPLWIPCQAAGEHQLIIDLGEEGTIQGPIACQQASGA